MGRLDKLDLSLSTLASVIQGTYQPIGGTYEWKYDRGVLSGRAFQPAAASCPV